MEPGVIIALVGIVLTNISVVMAAYVKMKTDITALNVKVLDNTTTIKEIELSIERDNKESFRRLEHFIEKNETQHSIISTKVDNIKDSISDLKTQIAKIK